MPLTLTVEDGSIVAGANSYATLAAVKAFHAQRANVLPATDDAIIALIVKATDYIEVMEPRFKGDRASPLLQALSWPRQNAWVFGSKYNNDPVFPSNAIPTQLVAAVCYLVGISQTVDLDHVQDTRAVIDDTIGPIVTKYDPRYGATVRPIIPLLDGMLRPLFNAGSGALQSLRI